MNRLILVLVLLLGACATPMVHSDVTRFHVLGMNPSPGSFTIVPDANQVGSLEFQNYATLVASALEARGWRPVPPGGGRADALVSLHWGVGAPSTFSYQTPSAVYGGVGWGHPYSWYGGGFYDPFPYWETRTETTFPRWLSVEMTEPSSGGRKVLFEGRAVSEGRSREISPVMPYLVRALFTGFPGSSGTTVQVDVPVEK